MHYDTLHLNILGLFALIGYFVTVAYIQNRLKEKYPKYANFFGVLAMVVFIVGVIWFGQGTIDGN